MYADRKGIMKQYAIQGYFPEYTPIGGPWMCVSAVHDLLIPSAITHDEATEILSQINSKFYPLTGRKYRIVFREVTPWMEVNDIAS